MPRAMEAPARPHYRMTFTGLVPSFHYTEAGRSTFDDPAKVRAVKLASIDGKLRRYARFMADGRLHEAEQVARSLAIFDNHFLIQ